MWKTTTGRGPKGFAILGTLMLLATTIIVAPTSLGHHDGSDHLFDEFTPEDPRCTAHNTAWGHLREWEHSIRRQIEDGTPNPDLPSSLEEEALVSPVRQLWDYGDAPDDSNEWGMRSTYTPGGSPIGSFRTLANDGNWETTTGARHRVVDVAWLGDGDAYAVPMDESPLVPADVPPSVERDADTLPDGDQAANLQGLSPDHDGHDNSVADTTLPADGKGALRFRVSSAPGIEEWYVNVLVDWNYDGTWNGHAENGAREWAVVNMPVSVSPATSRVYQTPAFPTGEVPGTPWVRITLSGTPVPEEYEYMGGWDGSTPWNTYDHEGYRAFACGETEDHCGIVKVSYGDRDAFDADAVRCDPDFEYSCDSHPSFAEIMRLRSGGTVFQAERVKWTGQTGLWLPGWAASMNGGFDAEIHYNCLEGMEIELYKRYDTTDGHVNDLVYANTVMTGCGSGYHVEDVEVGLDYGEYDLVVTWFGCDGRAGVDEERILVFDPPLFTSS